MKPSKLAIVMGFVTVALTACGGGSGAGPADFTITVIDGYIVDGKVTAHCGYEYQNPYTARTDTSGIASLFTEGASVTDCYAEVTGDEDTYDTDAPGDPWLYTMKSLPGLAVINPYTDIAATILENGYSLTRSTSLTVAELMQRVFAVVDPQDKLGLSGGGVDLFADYGANSADNSGLDSVTQAKVAVLAQSTFDTVTAIKTKQADATSANLETLYSTVLPQVVTAVNTKIQEVGEDNLETLVFSADITLPDEITFNEDGTLDTDLTALPVTVVESEKPSTSATGAETANQG